MVVVYVVVEDSNPGREEVLHARRVEDITIVARAGGARSILARPRSKESQ